MPFDTLRFSAVALGAAVLCACGGGSDDSGGNAQTPAVPLPRESTLLGECDALAAGLKLQNTTLKTTAVPAGPC